VLEFHRYKQVMLAAGAAKDKLKRQLERVLATPAAETLPAVTGDQPQPPDRKGLAGLKRLTRRRSP
jgi:hypothetical protein